MPTLTVEVAFSTGADLGTLLQLDDPSRGKLNTGTLGSGVADTPVWTDISAYVRGGSIIRGSNRVDTPIVTYEAGTLTVILRNEDARFDPNNLDGPYVDALNGTTQVTAMRAVRVRATWSGTTYDLFRGFVDAWEVQWVEPDYSECTLTATDAFKVFTGDDRPAVAAVGGGDTTGARVGRILDSTGWPASDRTIATGDTTVQATTLEGGVLAELQLTTDTELGELYMDGAGKVVFRNRLAMLEDTRSNTSQATFGDGGGAELPYLELQTSNDDSTFFNKVRVTAAGGTEQVANDGTSQVLYYTKTFAPSSELLMETDAVALAYAQWLLHVAADPETRFVGMVVNPRSAESTLFPQVLGREIGDRVTVIRRPPGGPTVTRDQFIRGIEHDFSAQEWQTTWSFQDADRYGSFLVLDHATLGKLDSGNALAF